MRMISTENDLLQFLTDHSIPYRRFEHAAVYTCEQADQAHPNLEGVSTKNLFLRDRAGRFYLIVTDCAKRIDLKLLGQRIGASKLHFAPEEKLKALLGVSAGAVTALGLVNDTSHQVQLLMDREIWDKATFQSHPLVNTSTLVLSRKDLEYFFELSGHAVQLVELGQDG